MLHGVSTGLGVSYFFVLSGFILTYVYPTFTRQRDVVRFIVARIARLWPLHATTLLIAIWLFPKEFRIVTFLPNLFMVHSWLPDWPFFFSYNMVSWSISTELGFYLCFPILIYGLDRNWQIKMCFAFGLTLLITYICKVTNLPLGSNTELGFVGFIYVNPMGRLYEFVVGMVTALTYRKVSHHYQPAVIMGTVVEIFSLISVLGILFYNHHVERYITLKLGYIFAHWSGQGGTACFLFGLFILVFALQKGILSRVLATKAFRFLGEISFSIYMIHRLILGYYRMHLASITEIPNGLAYGIFWLFLIIGSYLLWKVVEKPCRNYIVNFYDRRYLNQNSSGGKVIELNSQDDGHLPNTNKKAVFPIRRYYIVILAPLIVVAVTVISSFSFWSQQSEVVLETDPETINTIFGEKYILTGIEQIYTDRVYVLELTWKSLQKQKLRFNTAVHVVDRNGKIMFQHDKSQKPKDQDVSMGAIWIEKYRIPAFQVKKASAVAIGLYSKTTGLLAIDKGPRDWNNKRLVIPLNIP